MPSILRDNNLFQTKQNKQTNKQTKRKVKVNKIKNMWKHVTASLFAMAAVFASTVPMRADDPIEPIVPIDGLEDAVVSAQSVAVIIIGIFLGVLIFRWAVKLIKKAIGAAG